MRKGIVVLFIGVLISAVGVVYLRHESRLRFVELQGLQAKRDQLNVEWGKLLLEQGTWAGHGRIEELARDRLKMVMPTPDQIAIVRVE